MIANYTTLKLYSNINELMQLQPMKWQLRVEKYADYCPILLKPNRFDFLIFQIKHFEMGLEFVDKRFDSYLFDLKYPRKRLNSRLN